MNGWLPRFVQVLFAGLLAMAGAVWITDRLYQPRYEALLYRSVHLADRLDQVQHTVERCCPPEKP